MLQFLAAPSPRIVGPAGSLHLPPNDEISRKLIMLIEGQCLGLGPTQAAAGHGYTTQRYFQLLHAFEERGALALKNAKRGPKRPSRQTEAVVRQIIRHRFLDPEASGEVIAQKLRQTGQGLSARSVNRTIAAFGLQKKTLRLSAER